MKSRFGRKEFERFISESVEIYKKGKVLEFETEYSQRYHGMVEYKLLY